MSPSEAKSLSGVEREAFVDRVNEIHEAQRRASKGRG